MDRLKQFFAVAVLLLVNTIVFAQDADNPPSPDEGVPPPPPGLFPIDDHLWILVVVGIFLGIYYLKKKASATA